MAKTDGRSRATSGEGARGLCRRAVLALGIALTGAALAVAAAAPAARAAETPFRIVTTVAQIADPVRHVVGDRAVVESLMGEGVDPHSYRATRSDVARLNAADVIFYNGLYLEAQMEDMLERLSARKPVVALAESIDSALLLDSQDYQDKHDPHVWMDVGKWTAVTEAARDALIDFDPDGAETYRANAAAYLAELERLDEYARTVLPTVPDGARVLITAHDAFNYFGEAYGFEVVGIQGISTDSEAGLQRIEAMVDLLVDRGIAAVFVESSVADRNIRALIDGAAARGHHVEIGGTLFSDAMGQPGTYEGTYVGMLDHNITTITRALDGEAPVGGLNGRLNPVTN